MYMDIVNFFFIYICIRCFYYKIIFVISLYKVIRVVLCDYSFIGTLLKYGF